jgi:hypothetical protein
MSKQNHIVEPEELMAYLDGELPAKQAASTAAHLEHCHECQTLAAELKEVSGMLAGWEVEASEPELGERVAAALDHGERETSTGFLGHRKGQMSFRIPRGLLWSGGLAVAVGLIISIPNLMRSRLAANSANNSLTAPSQGSQETLKVPPKSAPARSEMKFEFSRAPQPMGTPAPGEEDQGAEESEAKNQEDETSNVPGYNGPMIIRTADLAVTMTTLQFDKARFALDEILKRHHGHIGELSVNSPGGSARSLTATLRIPGNRLDAALNDLKGLGRVDKESQGGEEVTQEYIDLQARLTNSRHTEQRLIDILRERTGKLSDVLSVEMQISRVRGEIERMEAQRKGMKNQVDFATVTLNVSEEYKDEIKAVPPSTSTRFRNAAIEGYRSLVDGIIAVLLWLLSAGPTLLLWAAILFFPARMLWRRARRYRRDRA